MVNIWLKDARIEAGLPFCNLVRSVDTGRMEEPAAGNGSMRKFWPLCYHWQFTDDAVTWQPAPFVQHTDNGIINY